MLFSSCATSLKQELKTLQEENKTITQKLDSLLTDEDEDGVPNANDLCPETPPGARVDGAGCAVDTDLDGIIDLYDKCVITPGIRKYEGCGEPTICFPTPTSGDSLPMIEFEKNSLKIPEQSIPYLENAANVILKYGEGKTFYIEGHSNASGSKKGNLIMSRKRAEVVKAKMVALGVNPEQLEVVAKGSSDLLYPECNPVSKCTEDKNQANRRVIFKLKE